MAHCKNCSRNALFLMFFSLSCVSPVVGGGEGPVVTPGAWLKDVIIDYESDGVRNFGTAQIYFPKGYGGGPDARTLIVLHGYRQTPADWEKRTPIAAYADRYGFVLVCPAMATTLYESKYYPETVNRWAPVPGSKFIADVLMPFIRKNFGLGKSRKNTGIFGISTGARGALMLAARHPKMFGAAAGLSGDYDSSSMKNDRILTQVFGAYEEHRERWEEEANVLKRAAALKKTPVYLGHGGRDRVVPPMQTDLLAGCLRRLAEESGGDEPVVEEAMSAAAGHDWGYWAAMVPEVLAFFDERLKR
ncbi:MAG: prolyl oligopeptidase family serine peptidase [Spirochaetes bacterium]|nr:prolyl oligopeptidase family serine peptidase [Spirochaetota bacterium]